MQKIPIFIFEYFPNIVHLSLSLTNAFTVRGSAIFWTLHTLGLKTAWLLTAVVFNRGIFSESWYSQSSPSQSSTQSKKDYASQWDNLSWPPIVWWQHRGYTGSVQSSWQVRINDDHELDGGDDNEGRWWKSLLMRMMWSLSLVTMTTLLYVFHSNV